MRTKPIPFADFQAEILALYAEPMRARATRAKIRHALELVAELGVTTTADLTPALVARLIASRPTDQSPATTDGLLRSLRVACTYAVGAGYLRVSPFTLRKTWLRVSVPRTAEKRATIPPRRSPASWKSPGPTSTARRRGVHPNGAPGDFSRSSACSPTPGCASGKP